MRKKGRTSRSMHSPTLNTILMVEGVLKSSAQPLSVADIKRQLPKKVMHGTLLQVLDYLQLSKKIVISTKGAVWVFEDNVFGGRA